MAQINNYKDFLCEIIFLNIYTGDFFFILVVHALHLKQSLLFNAWTLAFPLTKTTITSEFINVIVSFFEAQYNTEMILT